jgi:hypothetical protein
MTLQGCSQVTKIKEIQIKGLISFRLNQRKFQGSYLKNIGIFDIFCGDGVNSVDGESIDGSPIEIANAILETEVYKKKQVGLIASDNRESAVELLRKRLSKRDSPFWINVIKRTADEQLDVVRKYLNSKKSNHAILVVDPNGPATFPFEKLNALSVFSDRLDVIINISESAINRIKACGITKDKNWWANYETFEDIIVEFLKGYKEGFMRGAVKGDKQKWRIVTMWSWSKPKNDWKKQGLYKIRTKQDITTILNGGIPDGFKNTPIGQLFANHAEKTIQSVQGRHIGTRSS